ncbi:MAG: adenylate kinase [Acidobacteria bacterium]|nr:adenylate kinase [Acidobacteriota bacterium]
MILLLFGPPGCGKGTQAAFLAERFSIPAISTGEMFRAECKAGTDLGRIACQLISKGALVSDEIVDQMVARRISQADCREGFLLDGYPRTVPQAAAFATLVRSRGLPEPAVIHLDIPDELVVMRLTARRQCPLCKRIYNLLSRPPATAGICDDDGTPLITRDDDGEDVIRDRIRAYHQQTGPVLRWYNSARLHHVDGSQPPDRVARDVANAVIEASLAVPIT